MLGTQHCQMRKKVTWSHVLLAMQVKSQNNSKGAGQLLVPMPFWVELVLTTVTTFSGCGLSVWCQWELGGGQRHILESCWGRWAGLREDQGERLLWLHVCTTGGQPSTDTTSCSPGRYIHQPLCLLDFIVWKRPGKGCQWPPSWSNKFWVLFFCPQMMDTMSFTSLMQTLMSTSFSMSRMTTMGKAISWFISLVKTFHTSSHLGGGRAGRVEGRNPALKFISSPDILLTVNTNAHPG